MKTGIESIEATLRRRRILFAGYVARMEDTRLPKCVMFGELVGIADSVRERMDCFLKDPRAFGINVDKWTTAAQDEGKWRSEGWNVRWRNESFQRKPGLDYGMH